MPIKSLNDIIFHFEKYSENTAVIFNDGRDVKKSTYKQLSDECHKVSKCLQDLCADSFIGVFLEQDLALPAIILGILHTNLPFICIDIQDSEGNLLLLLKKLCIKWIFTKMNSEKETTAISKYGTEIKTLFLYEDAYTLWNIQNNYCVENTYLSSPSSSSQLAYAIHSSGSTGQPKMIFVPHSCIVPNIMDISEILNVCENDIFVLVSPLTFDPSIIEIFVPFSCGAALLIVPSLVRASPSVFLDILFPDINNVHFGVTILQITPSVFARWTSSEIRTRILNKTTKLKKLLFGGEPCPNTAVLRNWRAEDNMTEIFNLYGITEVSCWATIEKVDLSPNVKLFDEMGQISDEDVSLGMPFSKICLEVHNEKGETISEGEGELYIGSSERVCFLNEEIVHSSTKPVFRATGDIVKFHQSSNKIVFIGRKNRIIKRWGHQVYLNAIESVLREHPSVKNSVCVWDQKRNVLIVGIVWKENEDICNIRTHMLQHLHKSHIPDAIVTLESLPLTKHGKIDFEQIKCLALQIHDLKGADNNVPLATRILSVWKDTLGHEPLLSQDFMSSGGNSLLAIQLATEIEKVLGISIRNDVMNMLLHRFSVLEIINYVLGKYSDKRSEMESASQQTNSSRLNKTGAINCSQNETESNMKHIYKELTPSLTVKSSSSVQYSVIKKQKLMFDVLQSTKEAKGVQNGILPAGETNVTLLKQNENHLIKVCCRGVTLLRDSFFDSLVEHNKKIYLHFNWKFDMQKCVDASPCYLKFAKKCWVVIGSHSHLLAVLECSSGKVISQCRLPDRIESSVCPSVCGRYGIVGCYDGCVYCITLENGKILWSFSTDAMVKSTPSLCLGNTAVLVGSYDTHVYCINLQDGKLIWKTSVSSSSIFASPCTSSSNMVYIATLNGTCGSLCERTGRFKWKTQVSSPVFSSPALVNSSKGVIFSEVLGVVHCFSSVNGVKMWEFQANGEIFSSFSTICTKHGELIVFGSHDKYVYCLESCNSLEKVHLKWKQGLDSAVFATPFIYKTKINSVASQLIYELAIVNYVIASVTKGTIYVMKLEDGSIECSKTLDSEIFSSPVFSDGQLLVGCRDNYLYNFSITSK